MSKFEKIGGGSYEVFKPKNESGGWIGAIIGFIVFMLIIKALFGGGGQASAQQYGAATNAQPEAIYLNMPTL